MTVMTATQKKHRKTPKWLLIAALVLSTFLVVVYLLIPFFIKTYLNYRVLDQMGDYSGRIEDVDVHLFSGAYSLQDLVIYQTALSRDIPFFGVNAVDISVSWEALRHKEVLAKASLHQPVITFLDAQQEQEKQTGEGTNWLSVFEKIIPVTLHELSIHQGQIVFQNFDTDPPVNVKATEVNATLTNLTNVKDKEGRRAATAEASALVFESAPFSAKANFDPFDFNDFEFAAEAKEIDLNKINDFAEAYGNIDFKSGHGEVFVEIKAQDRELTGYIKPLFTEVNIASWKQDVEQQGDNPIQLLWETTWGFLSAIFTNQSTNKLATQVDISGTLSETEINSWQAVWGFIKNSFVEAIESQFESLTPLTQSDNSEQDDSEQEKPKEKGTSEKPANTDQTKT